MNFTHLACACADKPLRNFPTGFRPLTVSKKRTSQAILLHLGRHYNSRVIKVKRRGRKNQRSLSPAAHGKKESKLAGSVLRTVIFPVNTLPFVVILYADA